ncbi:exonuclease domain-containing protein [Corynebacterium sp. H113]|uniref:exonuclease domain-containing protein n=1 Tax=Corynebacterium sp. H113 TaxID=3133419 RepID=UPI0030A3441B
MTSDAPNPARKEAEARSSRRRRSRRRATTKGGSPRQTVATKAPARASQKASQEQATQTTAPTATQPEKTDQQEQGRTARAVKRAPYAVLAIQANGIHPKTGRMVSIAIATLDAAGNTVDTWHTSLTTGEDPGPVHLHGLTPEDLQGSPKFGTVLSKINDILDDRTLITHNAPMTWGFVVAEARKARRQANRANRNRRGRGRRSRGRVGKIPTPVRIVDTLETGRRQGVELPDTRLRGVASTYGIECASPMASTSNNEVAERDRTLDDIQTTIALFKAQGGLDDDATLAAYPTDQLRADRVGLQRSTVRVDAIESPAQADNPGKYTPGGKLKVGMEFAVAPEVVINPDELIEAGLAVGLTYSEKVTRETSILVCNHPANIKPEDLTGKAMHAHRKDIPLVSDEAFLRLAREA